MARESSIFRHLFRALFYALTSYGLVYFTYKYFVPKFGGIDYYSYYNIYVHPLRIDAGDAPFVYRQLGALLVHLVWKLKIYHQDEIAFVVKGYDQRVFFAAIFANWVALVGCATAVAAATRKLVPEREEAWPLLGGALCFFSFFAQQGVLAGLSEGVSWLLVAVGFLGWTRRSLPLVAAVLGLSVIQRETIPIVFGALSVSTFLIRRDSARFHAQVLAASVAAFFLYVALRLWWAPAQGNDRQLDPGTFVHLLAHWDRLATHESLFQVFLSQNLLLGLAAVSLVVALAKPVGSREPQDPPASALYLTALALAVVGVGILSQSNSLGRVLAILTPIVAPLLVRALARLFPPPLEMTPQAGRLV